jgi:hypothetical protein
VRLVGLVLVATLALTGCGRSGDGGERPPAMPATTPATAPDTAPDTAGAATPASPPAAGIAGQPDAAGVRDVEDIVNDLESVVGSAEAEAAADD